MLRVTTPVRNLLETLGRVAGLDSRVTGIGSARSVQLLARLHAHEHPDDGERGCGGPDRGRRRGEDQSPSVAAPEAVATPAIASGTSRVPIATGPAARPSAEGSSSRLGDDRWYATTAAIPSSSSPPALETYCAQEVSANGPTRSASKGSSSDPSRPRWVKASHTTWVMAPATTATGSHRRGNRCGAPILPRTATGRTASSPGRRRPHQSSRQAAPSTRSRVGTAQSECVC